MYKLYNGDCLEVMDRLIESGVKVDCILTDLPYGTTACKWDSVIDFQDMWKRLNRLISNNGAIILFGSEPFSSRLRLSNIKNFKHEWVWNKRNAANIFTAKYQPLKVTENIIVFSSGGKVNYYPIMTICDSDRSNDKPSKQKSDIFGKTSSGEFKKGNNKNGKERYPKNLIEFSNANRKNQLHPTQKPVSLLEYIIKTYTKKEQTVLDFTMGSGSTGIACLNTGRNFIGIELDANYYNISIDRISNHVKC